MERKLRTHLIGLFADLPEGRSDRNHTQLTQQQREAIVILREWFIPREIEAMLNISVYRINRVVVGTRHALQHRKAGAKDDPFGESGKEHLAWLKKINSLEQYEAKMSRVTAETQSA